MAKIEKEDAVERLKELAKKRRLIAMVGAGASIDSGLPTWEKLLAGFIEMCEKLPLRDSQKKDLDELLAAAKSHIQREPVRVTSVLKDRLKKILKSNQTAQRKYKNWLIGEFARAEPNKKHHLIVQTDFPYILTTNYDPLLEEAAARDGFYDLSESSYTFKRGSDLAGAIATRKPSIIHIHGVVDNLENGEIVFTQADYRDMIKEKYEGFSFALRMLFFDYSALYVGYGASDPHLEDISQDLTAYFPTDSEPIPLNTSYLILKRDKIDQVLVDYKQNLRMHLIPIDSYDEIDEILNALRAAAPRRSQAGAPDSTTHPAQGNLPGV